MMKLRKETAAPKAKAKASAGGQNHSRRGGRGRRGEADWAEWGKGSGKGWSDSWSGKGGGAARDRGWASGPAKRPREEYEEWAPVPPRKRAREYADWGPPPQPRSARAGSDFGWGAARSVRDPPSRPQRVEQREPPRRPAAGGSFTTIRVSNVPRDLDERDIQDAFEDIGRVLGCEVERGVAYVTFSSPQDAKTAVKTFDRGELNGQTIFVTPE